jgi:hypothetical protein
MIQKSVWRGSHSDYYMSNLKYKSMSYQIIYRGLAIKTSRGILPIFENGSNNCRVLSAKGNMVRERYWTDMSFMFFGQNLFRDLKHSLVCINKELFENKDVQTRGSIEKRLSVMFKYPITFKEAVNFGLCYYEYIDYKPYKRLITEEAALFDALTKCFTICLTDVRC